MEDALEQLYNGFDAAKTNFKYSRYPDKDLLLHFLMVSVVFEISQGSKRESFLNGIQNSDQFYLMS